VISQKSDRHPKLKVPARHGREFAVLGLECSEFRNLAEQFSSRYPRVNILVLDALHEGESFIPEAKLYREQGNILATGPSVEELERIFSAEADIRLVNGNHYPAKSQLIFTNSGKAGSVKRRKEQINNPVAAVTMDTDWKSFTKSTEIQVEHDIPVFDSIDQMFDWLVSQVRTPVVKALVLAGGKSERMGQDKVSMDIHGRPQWLHVAETLGDAGLEVFISSRQDRKQDFAPFQVISDRLADMGPYGAIISAFMFNPDTAWLVVATDMPAIDIDLINTTINRRNPKFMATAYRKPDGKVEPLFAIYEPEAYSSMLQGLSTGISCPGKWLKSARVNWLEPTNESAFTNLNTPEDLEQWLKVHQPK
jgi:molybdopterin-guanine dinucleotide biosynthesis protein A